MAVPKKRRTPRKQGMHRSHEVEKLAKEVNKRSPVKVKLKKSSKTKDTQEA